MKSPGLDQDFLLFSSPDAQSGFGALWETAWKIQEAASRAGFDWETRSGILDKLTEELEELKAADREIAPASRMEELGDLLFVLIHYAWWARIPLDRALEASTGKFRKRFNALRDAVALEGRELGDLSPAELDSHWREIKRQLAASPGNGFENEKSRPGRSDV
jgi:uncharacterized protein YabN with tetrapyrrole methylase and pyrophosphatase domain